MIVLIIFKLVKKLKKKFIKYIIWENKNVNIIIDFWEEKKRLRWEGDIKKKAIKHKVLIRLRYKISKKISRKKNF